MNEHGRLPWYHPNELDEPAKALYDRITRGPRSQGPQAFDLTDSNGRLHGPFNALLISPEVGTAVAELGSAIRYKSAFSPRAREIAILEVSAKRRSSFEWYAHERVGKQAGLTEAETAAIHDAQDAPTLTPTESVVRTTVALLLSKRDLDEMEFTMASEALGERGLMELIALVGYYDMLALSLSVWRTPLPAGTESAF